MRLVSEDALNRLHAAGTALGPVLLACLFGMSEADLKEVGTADRPKVHALVHFRYFIRRYGSALNFDTETWETLHQVMVHRTFERDCHRNDGRLNRLQASGDAACLLRMVTEERIPDPPELPRVRRFKAERSGETLGSFVDSHAYPNLIWSAARNSEALEGMPDAYIRELRVFDVLKLQYSVTDSVLYVASDNYLRKGPRHDSAAISLQGEADSPAEILLLFGDGKEQPLEPDPDNEGVCLCLYIYIYILCCSSSSSSSRVCWCLYIYIMQQ